MGPSVRRHWPTGSPHHQAISRSTGMAVAWRSGWRGVRANPIDSRSLDQRRSIHQDRCAHVMGMMVAADPRSE
jgi:hypothetical protein